MGEESDYNAAAAMMAQFTVCAGFSVGTLSRAD
jgi:hypothetical protein